MASHTHLQFFLGQLLEPMKPRSIHTLGCGPQTQIPLMKRKERYKPKKKTKKKDRVTTKKKADQVRAKGILCGLEDQ